MSSTNQSGHPVPRFGRPRPPAEDQVQKQHPAGTQAFQPLPAATGPHPYRRDLRDIVDAATYAEIEQSGRMRFHLFGDCGGVKEPASQQIVADVMTRDFDTDPKPAFLYLCGDVIYYNGQAVDYYDQFYEPYVHYPAPIVAIPGNHDGDALDPSIEPSLSAFVANFCSPTPVHSPDARDVERLTMTQPNVYWTLLTPVLTIVGIYTNVPEGGEVDATQAAWLAGELRDAPPALPLAVSLHHPIYSADVFHGGSKKMAALLDTATATAGRSPDVVLTGHVHNYQRFSRTVNGRTVPYVIAGAGGYWHLHAMAKDATGSRLQPPWTDPATGAILESYCDDRHGFLRINATATSLTGTYLSVPRPQESWSNGPVTAVDTFTIGFDGPLADHAPPA
jgi:predicted phosphodiesterase